MSTFFHKSSWISQRGLLFWSIWSSQNDIDDNITRPVILTWKVPYFPEEWLKTPTSLKPRDRRCRSQTYVPGLQLQTFYHLQHKQSLGSAECNQLIKKHQLCLRLYLPYTTRSHFALSPITLIHVRVHIARKCAILSWTGDALSTPILLPRIYHQQWTVHCLSKYTASIILSVLTFWCTD